MPVTGLPPDIRADIQGQISGQVAIGVGSIQVGPACGSVVSALDPSARPRAHPRAGPVFVRPRSAGPFLDRHIEVAAATSAVAAAQGIDLCGAAGLGKTTLLRRLAETLDTSAFPSGLAYVADGRQPSADILRSLYHTFYETEHPYEPSEGEVAQALQPVRALILVDDANADRDATERIAAAVPASVLVVASPERLVWGDARSVPLHGLPTDEALELLASQIGRRLTPEEKPAAEAICAAVAGSPLCLLQAAAMVRDDGKALAQVAQDAAADPAVGCLTPESLRALPEPEHRVLCALAVLAGAATRAEHVAAIAGIPSATGPLDTLRKRHLVEEEDFHYRLTGGVAEAVARAWDVSSWSDRALAHFLGWAEAHAADAGAVVDEADALAATLARSEQAARHDDTILLGRSMDSALAEKGRWGLWGIALQRVLAAARASGGRSAEAWALHQQGTRAICLGQNELARLCLNEAIILRDSLQERTAATLSRHNLEAMAATPVEIRRPERAKGGPAAKPRSTPKPVSTRLLAVTAVAALAVIGAAVWLGTRTTQPEEAPPTTLLTGLSLQRASIRAGDTTEATLTLSEPAPKNLTVRISVDTPRWADVQSSVQVPAGSNSAAFGVRAHPAKDLGNVPRSVLITATLGKTRPRTVKLIIEVWESVVRLDLPQANQPRVRPG